MIDVVAALIKIKGQYFIGKRISGEPSGLWEFPGGKVNIGETYEEAIIREIKEELNIHIKIIKKLGNVKHEYPTRTINLTLYLAEYISGDIKLNSHSEYKLVDINALSSYDLAPADKKLLPYIEKR